MSENKDLEVVVNPEQGEGNSVLPVIPQTQKKIGRPKGAKNKDTLFKELMTGNFQKIAKQNIEKTFQVLFEKAHEGDMKAIKLVLDRVVPVTKAVDLADMEKKGLTINISVGSLEDGDHVQARGDKGQVIEDANFSEVED